MVGRPKVYPDDTQIRVTGAGTRLNKASARRAIIDLLVENGGIMTMQQIDEHFGFDMRSRVLSLLRLGWVEVIE